MECDGLLYAGLEGSEMQNLGYLTQGANEVHGRQRSNYTYPVSVLGEYTFSNHWKKTRAPRSQSPIYRDENQRVSISVAIDH